MYKVTQFKNIIDKEKSMKHIWPLSFLGLVLLIAACSQELNTPVQSNSEVIEDVNWEDNTSIETTMLQAQFNPTIFADSINQRIAGRVKGHSFVIANEAGIEAKVSGGYAQAPGDGDVLMKTYIASNIGSVSKMFSGIALLNLFDKHVLSSDSVQDQLDTPIWDKLPPKWRSSYPGINLEYITYRNLLQHKAFLISEGAARAGRATTTPQQP